MGTIFDSTQFEHLSSETIDHIKEALRAYGTAIIDIDTVFGLRKLQTDLMEDKLNDVGFWNTTQNLVQYPPLDKKKKKK